MNDFLSFLNEVVKNPILDAVIDNNGNLYNGKYINIKTGKIFPLIKGNIVQKKINGKNEISTIIGEDNIEYPAGIDKNGKLISIKYRNNIALNMSGEELKIPGYIKITSNITSKVWKIDEDYFNLVPSVGTGWVNVKIDMEIFKRVKRYSKSIGTNFRGHSSFISKLNELNKMSDGLLNRKRKRETIQKEMSVIILLHTIKEIKNFFTPGSSGFLFESFIAGLIPNARVVDDNSEIDVLASENNHDVTYQIKLYNELTSLIPINFGTVVDYYVICIKYATKIVIYILDSSNIESQTYYDNFTIKGGFSFSQIKNAANVGNIPKYHLDIANIEEKIGAIAVGLKDCLDILYDELSRFQYNIETIISGVSEHGDLIGSNQDKFRIYYTDAQKNIINMSTELEKLVLTVSPVININPIN